MADTPEHDEPRELATIMASHAARVRRVLRANGVAERDLPDAQQDVFVVVFRRLPRFEARSSLATWLHGIARNVASEYRRRPRNQREVLAEAWMQEHGTEDATPRLEARDALARVTLALAGLDREKRDALLLYEIEGLSMHEVAAHERVPLKTAFSRFYAARRELASALQKNGIARSGLLAWLALAKTRLVSRAHALAFRAAQFATLTVVCALLPPASPASAPRSRRSFEPAALRTTVGRGLRPNPEQPRIAPEPERAHLPTAPAPIARVRLQRKRPARSHEPPSSSSAPSLPDPLLEDLTSELIVTRESECNLRPSIRPPLARDSEEPEPRTIRLHGPREAAQALEAELYR